MAVCVPTQLLFPHGKVYLPSAATIPLTRLRNLSSLSLSHPHILCFWTLILEIHTSSLASNLLSLSIVCVCVCVCGEVRLRVRDVFMEQRFLLETRPFKHSMELLCASEQFVLGGNRQWHLWPALRPLFTTKFRHNTRSRKLRICGRCRRLSVCPSPVSSFFSFLLLLLLLHVLTSLCSPLF